MRKFLPFLIFAMAALVAVSCNQRPAARQAKPQPKFWVPPTTWPFHTEGIAKRREIYNRRFHS
ncbi:MAG: hypothetical protein MZV63_71950 [Marinilabiliales bacterium]|nr:hypothetical protein [Marinilabiliales bacterium]